MYRFQRTGLQRLAVVVLSGVLAACSMTNERNYGACVIGLSATGGIAGGGTGGGTLVGLAVGAGAGLLVCRNDEVREEGAPAVMAAPSLSAAPALTDADGDGVDDDRDRCANTPAGVPVDASGCPRDDDGDAVDDADDRCANTPPGVAVDAAGCPLPEEVILTIDSNVLTFAFDSAALDASARAALDTALAVIRDNDEVALDVVGHTDSQGTDAYNQGLSERRAQAAVAYLVSRGVPDGKLRALGRGESRPVASNATEEGRARNRRVELVVR